jgi:hypothetical protein
MAEGSGSKNPGGISFLADFLNQKYPSPDGEPLPITQPLADRSSKAAEVQRMPASELLLDTVSIKGKAVACVTHAALNRFLIFCGHTHVGANAFRLFVSLIKTLDPPLSEHEIKFYNAPQPLKITDDLIFLGQYHRVGGRDRITHEAYKGTPLWGVPPGRFLDLVEQAEESQLFREQLLGYTDFMRPIVLDYAAAVRELVTERDATSEK